MRPWRGIGTVWIRRNGDAWTAVWTRYDSESGSEPFDQFEGTRQEVVAWARSVPARQRNVLFPPDTWADLESGYARYHMSRPPKPDYRARRPA